MRGRGNLPASKARAKRRKNLYLRFGFAAFLLVALIGGVSALAHVRAWRIATVAVVGVDTLSSDEIRAEVSRHLSGSYLWLVPKNNVLLYPKDDMLAGVYAAFPKVRSAEVRFKDFKTIEVAIEEREPTSVWCGTTPASPEPCYFMDTVGLLYAKAPDFSGPVYIAYFGALSAQEPLRASYLSSESFKSLAALIAELGKESQPVSVEVTRNDDVFVTFADGHQLFFARADAPENILSRLAHARKGGELNNIELSSVDYIDLRFGNRVYYKLRE